MRIIEDDSPENLVHELAIGDTVKIFTRQGEQHYIKIEHIGDSSLSGGGVEVSFDEIETIAVEESGTETGNVIGGIVIFVVAIGGIAYFSNKVFDDIFEAIFGR